MRALTAAQWCIEFVYAVHFFFRCGNVHGGESASRGVVQEYFARLSSADETVTGRMPVIRRHNRGRSSHDHRFKSLNRLVVLGRLVVQVARVPLAVMASGSTRAACSSGHDLRQLLLGLVPVGEAQQVAAVRQVLPAREVWFAP
jgi:hypothetical protein